MQNSSRFHGSDWSEIISFKQYTCTSSNKNGLHNDLAKQPIQTE